jgi:hypothetical protein
MALERSYIIEQLEQRFGVRYAEDLVRGHTGASIIRLRANDCSNSGLVAKFHCKDDPHAAANDIAENIYGYGEIEDAGAGSIIPNNYQTLTINRTPVIVMDYLGENFRTSCGSSQGIFLSLRDSLRQVIQSTVVPDPGKELSRLCLSEVAEKIRIYYAGLSHLAPEWMATMRDLEFNHINAGKAAIFLLDFTPDNVFVQNGSISFIDPWRQKTYIGHPAISIGQFLTLARKVYCLPGCELGTQDLLQFVLEELPSVLDTDNTSLRCMLLLGNALQYMLSAFVRVTSDPKLAAHYLSESLWAIGQCTTTPIPRSVTSGGGVCPLP